MKKTIETYQVLYCSGIAFSMRKVLQAEQSKSHFYQDVEISKNDKQDLEQQITKLMQRVEQVNRKAAETRLADERKHTKESTFFNKMNQQLKTQLEGIEKVNHFLQKKEDQPILSMAFDKKMYLFKDSMRLNVITTFSKKQKNMIKSEIQLVIHCKQDK